MTAKIWLWISLIARLENDGNKEKIKLKMSAQKWLHLLFQMSSSCVHFSFQCVRDVMMSFVAEWMFFSYPYISCGMHSGIEYATGPSNSTPTNVTFNELDRIVSDQIQPVRNLNVPSECKFQRIVFFFAFYRNPPRSCSEDECKNWRFCGNVCNTLIECAVPWEWNIQWNANAT